jgi:hypothetical protein
MTWADVEAAAARQVAAYGRPGETGVGDTLARFFGGLGLPAVMKQALRIFKFNCKCPERQAALNARYPYVQ